MPYVIECKAPLWLDRNGWITRVVHDSCEWSDRREEAHRFETLAEAFAFAALLPAECDPTVVLLTGDA